MSDFASDFASGGALLGGLERSDGTYLNYLSASSISTLLTCPEQFRLNYLLQRWSRGSAATALGKAYHFALQRNFEQKMFSGRDLPVDDVLSFYERGWGQALLEDIWWRNDDPGATKTLGAEMVKIAHKKLSPLVHPIAVEERFERPVPGVPLPIVGVVDLIEEGRIIDRKTDKQGAQTPRPNWRVQAMVYMSVYEKDFAWHVQSKSGSLRTYSPEQYKALTLHFTPGKQRSARLLVQEAWGMLQDFYTRYGLDQPWPGVALAHPFACKTCSHRAKCVWWT